MTVGRGRVVLAALLALTVAGCGDAETKKDSSFETPELAQVPIATESLELPFDRYELALSDRTRTQQDNASLIEQCLEERGFEVALAGDYIRIPDSSYLWGGPVGTLPRKHAEKYGYQAAPDGPFKAGTGIYIPALDNLTLSGKVSPEVRSDPQFLQAFDNPEISDAERERLEAAGAVLPPKYDGRSGWPTGCLQVVEEALDAPIAAIDKIAVETFRLAEAHPEVKTRIDAWSTCMKKRGHEYTAITDPYVEFDGFDVTEQQVKTALDDVDCTSQSGVADYLYAAWANYQEQAIKHDPELFEAHLESERGRMIAVQRELGDG